MLKSKELTTCNLSILSILRYNFPISYIESTLASKKKKVLDILVV